MQPVNWILTAAHTVQPAPSDRHCCAQSTPAKRAGLPPPNVTSPRPSPQIAGPICLPRQPMVQVPRAWPFRVHGLQPAVRPADAQSHAATGWLFELLHQLHYSSSSPSLSAMLKYLSSYTLQAQEASQALSCVSGLLETTSITSASHQSRHD